jgi:hypothetical protein
MSSDHIPLAMNQTHWPIYASTCRKCSEYIAVFPHPKAEPYKLWVCHKCACKDWFALCVQRGLY